MDTATTFVHLVIEFAFRVSAWVFFLWLDGRAPFVRHIDEDELWYYRYPSVESYVPKFVLYFLITFTPFTIYLIQYIFYKEKMVTIPSIISSFYGLTLAYCMTGVFVAVLKLTVGKPRPNFYLRCFPDGYGSEIDMCDGEYHGQMDGRKGFPSAHATFIFCCMTYMCFHVYRFLNLHKPRFLKGVIITGMFLMPLTATLIAISRTMDYHHHYADVIGGGLIGAAIAFICQHLYSVRDEVLDANLRKIVNKEKY